MDYEKLIQLARNMGATEAGLVAVADISVEDRLAGFCLEPGCEKYGLSASCPPHVGGPLEFRELVKTMVRAVVFKIDLPSEILLSSDRREVMQLVHEIAARVEAAARALGAVRSRAFAGGSCKSIFCHDQPDCRVVAAGGPCRNPDLARPSMSGFGINVGKLMEKAGWRMWRAGDEGQANQESMGTVAGLILIG